MKRYEYAIMAFRHAKNYSPNINNYIGIVESYIALQRYSEAAKYASEANTVVPGIRSQSLQFLVLAHSHSEDDQKKAKEGLLNILKTDPNCFDAILNLAKMYKIQEKYDQGITYLQEVLGKFNRDFFHIALAELYVASEKYDDAILHYTEALKINPLNEIASEGKIKTEGIAGKGTEDDEERTDNPEPGEDPDTD